MVYPHEAVKIMREHPSYKEYYPLHDAVNSGDLNLVRTCLQQQQNGISAVESKDICKKTPLQCAIESIDNPERRYEVCEYLLNRGADVNGCDGFNEQIPLHSIWIPRRDARDDGRLFDLLVSRGAFIDVKESQFFTPLYLAVACDDNRAVEKLLDLGADPNGVDNLDIGSSIKASVLLRAIETQNENVIRLLFESGMDLSNTNEYFFLEKAFKVYLDSEDDAKYANKRMLNAVLKQVAIQKMTDRSLMKQTLRMISKNAELKEELERYMQQIDQMKVSLVCENPRVSYFDVLISDRRTIMRLCNEDIVATLSLKKPELLFPDFVGRMRRSVQRGTCDKRIMESFEVMLYGILKAKLTRHLTGFICKFLTIADLTGFRFRQNWESYVRNFRG